MIHDMETTSTPRALSKRSPGRIYLLLGIGLALSGPIAYLIQIQAKHFLGVPWYAAVLGTAGVLLLLVALVQARTVTRFLVLGLVVLVAGLEWYFLLGLTKLPAYTGPVSAGTAFPAFTASSVDGSPFTQESLKGNQNTAMVFFRGRW